MNIKSKTIRKCMECGKEFQTYPYSIKKNQGKYCSRICGWRNNPTKIKKGQRLSPKTEFKKGQRPHNWIDGNVNYDTLHHWVSNHLGKLKKCEMCGDTSNRKYAWANKSGKYKRDLSDWLRLCYSCHKIYDNQRRIVL